MSIYVMSIDISSDRYDFFLTLQGTPFDMTVPDLDTRIDPHSAPSQYHTTRQRPKTEYIGKLTQ